MPDPNPNVTVESVAERIRDSFPGDLGVEPLEVDDERFVGRMVVDRRHPGGLVHGGPGSRSPTRSARGRPSVSCPTAATSRPTNATFAPAVVIPPLEVPIGAGR